MAEAAYGTDSDLEEQGYLGAIVITRPSFRQHRTSQFGNSAICFRPPPPSPLFIDYAHSSNGHFWIQGNLNTRNSIVFANSRAHVASILIAISNLSNSDTKHITSHIVSEDGMCENAHVPPFQPQANGVSCDPRTSTMRNLSPYCSPSSIQHYSMSPVKFVIDIGGEVSL